MNSSTYTASSLALPEPISSIVTYLGVTVLLDGARLDIILCSRMFWIVKYFMSFGGGGGYSDVSTLHGIRTYNKILYSFMTQ